jgi:hypothetical protein
MKLKNYKWDINRSRFAARHKALNIIFTWKPSLVDMLTTLRRKSWEDQIELRPNRLRQRETIPAAAIAPNMNSDDGSGTAVTEKL